MSTPAICVVGSINLDMNAYVERFPRPGETIHGRQFTTGYGGKGANQAVMAARMGSAVQMVGPRRRRHLRQRHAPQPGWRGHRRGLRFRHAGRLFRRGSDHHRRARTEPDHRDPWRQWPGDAPPMWKRRAPL
jgi:hypothetical protein